MDGDGRDLPITENCAAAIRALMPMGVRHLWIDAVCINQSDTSDKESQVPLMGEIYSQASLVVGHLRPVISLLGFAPVGRLIHKIIQSLHDGEKGILDFKTVLPHAMALSEVFSHQYFQRAWIVQEIVLAKSLLLIYGNDCMHLDHLMAIACSERHIIMPRDYHNLGPGERKQCPTLVGAKSEFRDRSAVIEKLRQSLQDGHHSRRLTIAYVRLRTA